MKIVRYFIIGLIVICFTGCSGEGGNEPLLPPFGGVAEVPIAWGVDGKVEYEDVTDENRFWFYATSSIDTETEYKIQQAITASICNGRIKKGLVMYLNQFRRTFING